MRLLRVDSLKLTEFPPKQIPTYAILSHRWGPEEITFQEIERKTSDDVEKEGYKKVQDFASYVKAHLPHIEWIWVDTCCINKNSDAEMSTAINSMYKWFRDAEICVAYLADVTVRQDLNSFEKSVWFRRGWTLQELLAPQAVVFLTRSWEVIGRKGRVERGRSGILFPEYNPLLISPLARITGIPEDILDDVETSKSCAVEEKLQWMAGRETTVEEDMSYSLLGLLDLTMGIRYGEGGEKARQRVLAKARKANVGIDSSTAFQGSLCEVDLQIIAWLNAPDPQPNHAAARKLCEPLTGQWFLKSEQYQKWKIGQSRHLWLSGKPGCGKTVLCSSVIEDIKIHCRDDENSTSSFATFYFTFSDSRKQSYDALLRSLVAQLSCPGPGMSRLHFAFRKLRVAGPHTDELEEILQLMIGMYDTVYLLLDALDECPECDADRSDARYHVLHFLELLSEDAPNVKIFATSRELLEIEKSMQCLRADTVIATEESVDSDICSYVQMQISRDPRLSRMSADMKILIADTFARKADGMFRWAFCQLQALKKLKSTRPSLIRKALSALPSTLDETYERILAGIEEPMSSHAHVLLKWLAYARTPLSLDQFREVAVIDVETGSVHKDDRGSAEDTLDILAGLVTIDKPTDRHSYWGREGTQAERIALSLSSGISDPMDGSYNSTQSYRPYPGFTRVRLAHYSVKEYLESDRILKGKAEPFHLDDASGHRFLTLSCLTYLTYYSSSPEKSSNPTDLATFPMLQYSAKTWFHHCALQQASDVSPECEFLGTESVKYDWLRVHRPDYSFREPLQQQTRLKDFTIYCGSALYLASYLGLVVVVKALLARGANVNVQGGVYGSPLRAAIAQGHERVVEVLLDAGANFNPGERGHYLWSWSAKNFERENIRKMLLAAGVDINALNKDELVGDRSIVKMSSGADVQKYSVKPCSSLSSVVF